MTHFVNASSSRPTTALATSAKNISALAHWFRPTARPQKKSPFNLNANNTNTLPVNFRHDHAVATISTQRLASSSSPFLLPFTPVFVLLCLLSVMATGVDAKLLKSTKFPPIFNQKVDMQKVNLQVMKKYDYPFPSLPITSDIALFY